MEEIWINEFIYTKDMIPESKGKWLRHGMKAIYVLSGIMVVLVLRLAWVKDLTIISLLILECAPIFLIFYTKGTVKKAVRSHCERFEMLEGNSGLQIHTEVGSDIYYKSGEDEFRCSLAAVRKVLETKNFIIVCLKGDLSVLLHKNGFIQGDAKTCIAYLKSEMKSR